MCQIPQILVVALLLPGQVETEGMVKIMLVLALALALVLVLVLVLVLLMLVLTLVLVLVRVLVLVPWNVSATAGELRCAGVYIC